MVTVTTPPTYVASVGEYPLLAGTDLDTVKARAQAHAPQKDWSTGLQREFRWDETADGTEWQLMALNQRTNRWGKAGSAIRTAELLDAEPPRPSPDHSAVYIDQHNGSVWSDYPTVPPGDDVLPMVWASEKTQSREDLADRGVELRIVGWIK